MGPNRLEKFWLIATFVLITIIIISVSIFWARRDNGQPVIIREPPFQKYEAQILIEGAVNSPGIYPLNDNDSLEAMFQISGGVKANADLSRLTLTVPGNQEAKPPQKIDINFAEAWLLEALPEIGPTRADAIVQYRKEFGLFHNVTELTHVPGISPSLYEKIKYLITVSY